MFLGSLIGALQVADPGAAPGKVFLWLLFTATASIGGFGVVYELVISHGYLGELRRITREEVRGTALSLARYRPEATEAELQVILGPLEEGITDDRTLLRLAISKRSWTHLDQTVRILVSDDEEQSVESLWRAKPVLVWAVDRPRDWPISIPLLEVTRLEIDGTDFTGQLRPCRIGELAGYECGVGEPTGAVRFIRVDVRTLWRQPLSTAQDHFDTFGIYPPSADRVVFRFDGTQAGYGRVWLEGTASEKAPAIYGREGRATVEVVLEDPPPGQQLSVCCRRASA